MKGTMLRRWVGAFCGLVASAFCVGCGHEAPKPDKAGNPILGQHAPSAGTSEEVTVIPKPAFDQPVDETRNYFHQPSGTRFVYPQGWQISPATTAGPITKLALGKEETAGPLVVTLTWTSISPTTDARALAFEEVAGLQSFCRDKVSPVPERIRVGDQCGYKVRVDCGPLRDPGLRGVSYVFLVSPDKHQSWKVKLRATIDREAELKVVEDLLHNYRWK